jgi:hypothetical protein
VLDRTITQAREQARQDAGRAAERRRQVEQLQQQIRDRAAAQDWDAVMAASDQVAALDPTPTPWPARPASRSPAVDKPGPR